MHCIAALAVLKQFWCRVIKRLRITLLCPWCYYILWWLSSIKIYKIGGSETLKQWLSSIRIITARIEAGMNDPDPEKRAQWERIPRAGKIPTPEEWLRYAVERIEAEGRGDLLRWYPNLWIWVHRQESIDFSTNHEGLSQPIMKIGGAGSTTVLASCLDL